MASPARGNEEMVKKDAIYCEDGRRNHLCLPEIAIGF